MAATFKLTATEWPALVGALEDQVGTAKIVAVLLATLGAERTTKLVIDRKAVPLTRAEKVALINAIIPLIPGDTEREKLRNAGKAAKKAFATKERFDEAVAYIVARIKAYKVGNTIPTVPINDGFLRFYGRVNLWCAAGEEELRKDITLCGALGVGYQIEMAGWRSGETAFDSEANLTRTIAMYRKLDGWCKQAGIPILVSCTNFNITLTKYGNKGRPFSTIIQSAKRLAQAVFECGGKAYTYFQPVAETGKDKAATDFEKWCGTLFAGWKLVYNGGSRPSKPSYGWPHFAYHPNSSADGGKAGGISISDTGTIIKQLASDGSLNGPGDPAKVSAWFSKAKAAGAVGAGYYAFLREKHDAAAIKACAAAPGQHVSNPDEFKDFPAELSAVTWLHANVRDWPQTAKLTASIDSRNINFHYDKANVWPVATSGTGKDTVGNVWAIVKVGNTWFAGTWEWLRKGQTSKVVGCLNGAKGDHFKVSPLNKWRPKSGEQFYLMVSGHARTADRNVKERSNPVKVKWP